MNQIAIVQGLESDKVKLLIALQMKSLGKFNQIKVEQQGAEPSAIYPR